MTAEREQLLRARELILDKQFDAARLILLDMPQSEQARQWLAKLEEIAPTGIPVPDTPPAPPPASPSPIQPLALKKPLPGSESAPRAAQTVNLTLDLPMLRYALSALAGIMGLLMILSFFAFPWLDLGQMVFFGMNIGAMASSMDVDEGPLKVTAMELWMGQNNGENFTLNLNKPEGGFADVRLIDRLLILIPAGGLVLMWFAWMYASGEMVPLVAASSLVVVALLLLLAPLVWQDLSDQAFEDDFRDSMTVESGGDDLGFDFGMDLFGFGSMFSDTYSTGEQQTFGAVAFLAGLIAVGAEVLSQSETRRL